MSINHKMKKQHEMLLKAFLDGQSLQIKKLHQDNSNVLTEKNRISKKINKYYHDMPIKLS